MSSPRRPADRPEPAQSRDPADRLAEPARRIRKAILQASHHGDGNGRLRALKASFERALSAPLTREHFADMVAQTVACSLFSVGWSHDGPKPITLQEAAKSLPGTDPLLRQLFEILPGMNPAGHPFQREVEDVLRLGVTASADSNPADVGPDRACRDPALHFCEEFLRAYDPSMRGACGVYFTPEPIVSYIVRSVDHLLAARFGWSGGLVDGRVLILDPACGAGAFLSGVIDHVRSVFMRRNRPQDWSEFVRRKLLPRLFGFELLGAPWAAAHLRLAEQLSGRDLPPKDTKTWSCRLGSDERLHVYLANPLGGADRNGRTEWDALRTAERTSSAAVVLGNPPYSGISANRSAWIDRLLKGKPPDGRPSPGYYEVDGRPLRERKLWLQDDYVKFMRFGQWVIERAGAGILAFVTNHAYLDNPTFRGMRRSLMHTFRNIYVLDLHGNAKKKEAGPRGSRDENVFDIQQGVSIGLFVRPPDHDGAPKLRHAEQWGSRASKYGWLRRHDVGNTRFKTLEPDRPFYFFVPKHAGARTEYEHGWKITDIMPAYTTGIVTARDHFVTDFDEKTLLQRMAEFRSTKIPDQEIRQRYFAGKGSPKYPPGDTRGWKLEQARELVRRDRSWKERVVPCLYRPFDIRPMYYVPWMVDWPRPKLMRHMLAGENLALITVRQVAEGTFNHVFVSDTITDGRITLSNKGIAYVFPLYLYPNGGDSTTCATGPPMADPPVPSMRRANLNPEFVTRMSDALGLRFTQSATGDLKRTFGPQDVLGYLYAAMHSPAYRNRYAEFLRSDFPRVQIPADRALFRRLVRTGRELCSLHILQHAHLDRPEVGFPMPGANVVAQGFPKYVAPGAPDPYDPAQRPPKQGRVYINKDGGTCRAQYFEGVTPEVWHHELCGYQPARKYLADRCRRTLTHADITHYRRLTTAISRTRRLVDRVESSTGRQPESQKRQPNG